jgi:anti-sigma B factor antagonist
VQLRRTRAAGRRPEEEGMNIEERFVGEVAIVKVTGEITLKKGGDVALHEKVRSLMLQGHRKVLLDLAGVSYVDSAGLGELIQAYSASKNHGGSLKLFNPTKRLQELLVVTDLARVFDRFDDEAKALASFGT